MAAVPERTVLTLRVLLTLVRPAEQTTQAPGCHCLFAPPGSLQHRYTQTELCKPGGWTIHALSIIDAGVLSVLLASKLVVWAARWRLVVT